MLEREPMELYDAGRARLVPAESARPPVERAIAVWNRTDCVRLPPDTALIRESATFSAPLGPSNFWVYTSKRFSDADQAVQHML